MKTMTRKLTLLLLLSSVLLLTSCLDSSQGYYIGKEEYSYILRDQKTMTVYARTAAGYWITSEQISLLTPKTTAFISYHIDFDEAEKVLTGENNNVPIWVATTSPEPIILDQKNLIFGDAPDVPAVNFESLLDPTYIENDLFGDCWLFPYTINLKKGETARINFYRATEMDPAESTSTEVIIDVRVEKIGTPETDAKDKLVGDYVVADLSELRNVFADNTDLNGKISLKFRYFRSDKDGLYTSNRDYSMFIEQK